MSVFWLLKAERLPCTIEQMSINSVNAIKVCEIIYWLWNCAIFSVIRAFFYKIINNKALDFAYKRFYVFEIEIISVRKTVQTDFRKKFLNGLMLFYLLINFTKKLSTDVISHKNKLSISVVLTYIQNKFLDNW